MLHRPRVASSSRPHASTLEATRCERCGAFDIRFAAIRDALYSARASRTGTPTVALSDRVSDRIVRQRCRPRDGFEATPTVVDDDASRRVVAEDAIRRFDVSRARGARARTARRAKRGDARRRRGRKARGARGRARDDEGRRGELK